MKRTSLLKGLVVIVLSLLLVANVTSLVFADDNSFDDWDTPNTSASGSTSESASGSASGSASDTDTENIFVDTTNNVSTNNISTNTGSATTTLSTDNTEEDDEDDEENEVNSLAYTGIEDTNFLALFVVIGVIVAAYSFKKIKEYNKF